MFTEHQAAAILNLSVATLRRRRLRKQPPTYCKLGASVRYTRESIQRLIETGLRRAEKAK